MGWSERRERTINWRADVETEVQFALGEPDTPGNRCAVFLGNMLRLKLHRSIRLAGGRCCDHHCAASSLRISS